MVCVNMGEKSEPEILPHAAEPDSYRPLEDVLADIRSLQRQREPLAQRNSGRSDRILVLKNTLIATDRDRINLTERVQDFEKRMQELEAALAKARAQYVEAQGRLESVDAESTRARTEIEGLERDAEEQCRLEEQIKAKDAELHQVFQRFSGGRSSISRPASTEVTASLEAARSTMEPIVPVSDPAAAHHKTPDLEKTPMWDLPGSEAGEIENAHGDTESEANAREDSSYVDEDEVTGTERKKCSQVTRPRECVRCALHGYRCEGSSGPGVSCLRCSEDHVAPCSLAAPPGKKRRGRQPDWRLDARLASLVEKDGLSFNEIVETKEFDKQTASNLRLRYRRFKARLSSGAVLPATDSFEVTPPLTAQPPA